MLATRHRRMSRRSAHGHDFAPFAVHLNLSVKWETSVVWLVVVGLGRSPDTFKREGWG